jgi:hypothetical protein
MKTRIAYYITPHGFGHAVRSLVVINELFRYRPGLEIVVVSDVPEYLIRQNLTRAVDYRRRRLDVGLVQLDSLRFDLPATVARLRALYDDREQLVEEEIAFFRDQRIGAIICDIPFLPFRAAARYRIPRIGLGNFTWDWIYRAYADAGEKWQAVIPWIQDAYRQCELFLQLPMHGDCSVCPRIIDVPLVTRRATRPRAEVRSMLGAGAYGRMYLISFTDLDLSPAACLRLEQMADTLFVYKKPLLLNLCNGRCLDDLPLSYADVVAGVDGVITKPGYGIVADCLAHGTPMIYSDRGLFPEYEILVQAIEAQLNAVYLPSAELYAGNWESAIQQLEARLLPVPAISDAGGRVCAEAILAHLGWS